MVNQINDPLADDNKTKNTQLEDVQWKEFENRVAGHAGQLFQLSQTHLIKKTNTAEYQFYETAQKDFPQLIPFLPTYYGLHNFTMAALDSPNSDSGYNIILENLIAPFPNPSVIDIKLGIRHYEDTASPEKRAKMERKAKETTSFETGLKICGMRVCQIGYPPDHPSFVRVYEREYGRALTKETLPRGFEAFFQVETLLQNRQKESGIMIQILESILDQVLSIINVVKLVSMRMYSGSILIVYDHSTSPHLVNPNVRLLDFARSSFVSESEGPDEGLLFGLTNLVDHFKRILRVLKSHEKGPS